MDIKKVTLIYFSPTGTTLKVLEGIARGMGVDNAARVDLTLPAQPDQAAVSFSDELVLVGAPVYGGRLPVQVIDRLKGLKGENTLAVPVVVYGNREFEDALLELKDLVAERGFYPVAGGAFIGEHSFSTKDIPIAQGRPDEADLLKAAAFGKKISEKIGALPSVENPVTLDIPGRFPYEGGVRKMTAAPVTRQALCTVCGDCAGVCPTGAVSVEKEVTTAVENCIRCCACIKACPEDARVWEDEMMKNITNWLYENCSVRKEPQVFGVDG